MRLCSKRDLKKQSERRLWSLNPDNDSVSVFEHEQSQ